MKQQSRRARRMDRHHKMAKTPALNLVSLMDIFTILVFFLLVNSSTSEQLPNSKDLKLPNSISRNVPEETLTIAITREQVLVQGRSVARIETLLQQGEELIAPLKDELLFHAGNTGDDVAERDASGRAVMIMGHEEIPYQIISRILKTCQQAGYTQIAFAANQTLKQKTAAR